MIDDQTKAGGGGGGALRPRVKGNSILTSLLLVDNLDDFVPAPEPADNPDLAPGDAEMLCQQFDDC